ncbi:MAG: hypothetical protein RLZZ164_47 [Actinomycetota bacterium]|jgi:hypothetical protein
MTLRNKLYVSAAMGSLIMVVLEVLGFGHQYYVLSWCQKADEQNCWMFVNPLKFRLTLGVLAGYVTWQLLQIYATVKNYLRAHRPHRD